MKKPEPILIGDLLHSLDDLLMDLVGGLSPSQWNASTLATHWTVKNVAAHLLDGNLRTLSMLRDGHFSDPPDDPASYRGMVNYLNRLNAEWVLATNRLSTSVLIDLLRSSGRQYCQYLMSLVPEAPAAFPVAWAGENESKNWFHIAREYTEKWHHQQQIRHATGVQPTLLLRDYWFIPYLNTSVRALPHNYRHVDGRSGDCIKFIFRGATDKIWYLHYSDHWALTLDTSTDPRTEVLIHDDVAWKIFTKGIERKEALNKSTIAGDTELGLPLFEMVAVMA